MESWKTSGVINEWVHLGGVNEKTLCVSVRVSVQRLIYCVPFIYFLALSLLKEAQNSIIKIYLEIKSLYFPTREINVHDQYSVL